MESVDSAQGS